jgi:hypothetical protein
MTKYLISFPSRAMEVADDEWELVGREAHALVQQAKDAGAWVFGGGIDESVAPVRVAGDGTASEGAYPENERLSGRFAVLELPSRDAALGWAAHFGARERADAAMSANDAGVVAVLEPCSDHRASHPPRFGSRGPNRASSTRSGDASQRRGR